MKYFFASISCVAILLSESIATDATRLNAIKSDPNDAVLLQWNAEPSNDYLVLYSDDLTVWQNAISGKVYGPDQEEQIHWSDTNPTLDSNDPERSKRRFFRVVQVPSAIEASETAYTFVSISGESVDAFRGSFRVPENRTKPDSRELDLFYVRFPSTSQTPGSPIVHLAGGPGNSSVEDIGRDDLFDTFMELRAFGDVIAFDLRGTGWSNDIPPFQGNPLPLEQPLTLEAIEAQLAEDAIQAKMFWEETGVDISGYNPLEIARDLDDLRRTLGAEKLSLWGGSHGSHFALAAIREMPGKIDRVVLHSIVGIEQMKLPTWYESYLNQLQAAINTQPGAAGAFPDFRDLMRRTHAKFDTEPMELCFDSSGETICFVVGKLDLQLWALATNFNPTDASNLMTFYRAAESGNLAPFAPFIYEGLRKDGLLFSGMREGVYSMSGISDTRRVDIIEQSESSTIDGQINFPFDIYIDVFDLPDLSDIYRANVVTDVPTIAFSGTLDARTHPEAAEEALTGFSSLKRVTVRNGGHFDYFSNPAVRQMTMDFFRGQQVPDEVTLPLPNFSE